MRLYYKFHFSSRLLLIFFLIFSKLLFLSIYHETKQKRRTLKSVFLFLFAQNEKWVPFGDRWNYKIPISIFRINEKSCISTSRSMFWVFLSQTHCLFLNRDSQLQLLRGCSNVSCCRCGMSHLNDGYIPCLTPPPIKISQHHHLVH